MNEAIYRARYDEFPHAIRQTAARSYLVKRVFEKYARGDTATVEDALVEAVVMLVQENEEIRMAARRMARHTAPISTQ